MSVLLLFVLLLLLPVVEVLLLLPVVEVLLHSLPGKWSVLLLFQVQCLPLQA
jgi:hypothetical protein